MLSHPNRRTRCFLSVILFSFIFHVGVNGQQLNFLTYGAEAGIPQSTIYEIFQDGDGYLWLGTDGGGLCRFDGHRFKTYGKRDGLKANVVRKIIQDATGTLWMATNNGLYFLKDDVVKPFDRISNNQSIYFASVFVDAKQNIWAASLGKGLFRIPHGGGAILNFTSGNGLSGDYVFDVCADAAGKIWVASFGNGLDVYNPASNTFMTYQSPEGGRNEVICLRKLDDHTMGFGTRSAGAYKISTDDPDPLKTILLPGTAGDMVWSITGGQQIWASTDLQGVVASDGMRLNKANGLPTNQVLKVLVDREKNLWIGTNGAGLCKYLGRRFVHYTSEDLPGLSQVTAVAKLNQGYWAGTLATGLFNFEKGKPTRHYDVGSGLPANNVTGLAPGKDQSLWISTRNGISHFTGNQFKNYSTAQGLIDSSANCIYADSKNRIWVGTSGGLSLFEEGKFINISESNGLINNEVQCFAEDNNGHIWIGTFGGLVKFDGQNLHAYFEEDGLAEKKILCLARGPGGNLYIGTFGGGIYKFNVNNPSKKPIDLFCGEGLSSNNIYSLVFTNDTTLMAATNQGINQIVLTNDEQIKRVRQYSKADGFTHVESNQNAAMLDTGGTIFFGTPAGITVYDPRNDVPNSIRPAIRVTHLKVNGQPHLISEHLELGHSENNLEVSFVSVSLSNPQANAYYARLIGLDSTWTRLVVDQQEKQAFMTTAYKKLPPGRYILQLKSTNNDGVASEVAAIRLHISKPFYQTAWFITCMTLLALVLVWLVLKYRERQLVLEKQRLESLVGQRTAELVKSNKKIEAQKDLLQLQHLEITDSINYSKRIQNAILPERAVLDARYNQNFILYRPKDIVSGDFYFFDEADPSKLWVAVADCTGHGVPGALMSMIGNKELSDAVKENVSPGAALGTLNAGLRATLKQNEQHTGVRDGMDIALVLLNKRPDGTTLHYAGANRPVWILRQTLGGIEELRPTKAAIGGHTQNSQVFEQYTVELLPGDSVFLFSDGFADQFGGPTGKKMMTRRFKELLLECRSLPMRDKERYLSEFFDRWKGTDNEQVDDVLVIGIQV